MGTRFEGPKRGDEVRTENGNEASAAAGARFGRTEAPKPGQDRKRQRGQRCRGSTICKDLSAGTRPALQRQRYLEGTKTRRRNGTSAAAGATFLKGRKPSDCENTYEKQTRRNPVNRKTMRGGGPAVFRTESGE